MGRGIFKNDMTVYSIYSIYLTCFKCSDRLKVKGQKKREHANTNQKKGEVVMLILNEVDLGTKKITRDKTVHYVMLQGSIHQETNNLKCTRELQSTQSKNLREGRKKQRNPRL